MERSKQHAMLVWTQGTREETRGMGMKHIGMGGVWGVRTTGRVDGPQ